MSEYEPEALRTRWQTLREQDPRLRIRDAAEKLDVAEAQLVALSVGETATRLRGGWADLLLELHRLGPVMGLTRNDHAVHERHATYQNLRIVGDVRIVQDEGFEAGLFLAHWHSGFAVSESVHGLVRHSLQFFARDGRAVHKIYSTKHTRPGIFDEIAARYRAVDQSCREPVERMTLSNPAGVHERFWSSRMLPGWPRESDGTLVQTPDLTIRSGADMAVPLDRGSAEHLLTRAAQGGIALVIAVGNPGALQLHRGTVHQIRRTGPWINVLDEAFSLHLRDTQVATTWRIRETGPAGSTVSLGLSDQYGQPVAQFFGQEDSREWASLMGELSPCQKPGVVAA